MSRGCLAGMEAIVTRRGCNQARDEGHSMPWMLYPLDTTRGDLLLNGTGFVSS